MKSRSFESFRASIVAEIVSSRLEMLEVNDAARSVPTMSTMGPLVKRKTESTITRGRTRKKNSKGAISRTVDDDMVEALRALRVATRRFDGATTVEKRVSSARVLYEAILEYRKIKNADVETAKPSKHFEELQRELVRATDQLRSQVPQYTGDKALVLSDPVCAFSQARIELSEEARDLLSTVTAKRRRPMGSVRRTKKRSL